MFLIPAIIAAAAIELGSAIKTTENQPHTTPKVTPESIGAGPSSTTRTPRRFASSDDSMSDKQIVVFGTPTHPGINTAAVTSSGNYTDWKNAITEKQIHQLSPAQFIKQPLVLQACHTAVRAALPGFTPEWVINTGTDICFNALKWAAAKGLPIVQKTIVDRVVHLWNGMTKKGKAALTKPRAIKAAKNVVSAISTPPSKSTTGAYMAGVSYPAAMSNVVGKTGSAVIKNRSRGVIISHSEMISTLTSSATSNNYTTNSFVINPAKADVFPWLSSIAINYDKYRIRRMTVHLNSMQPTSVAGKMGIAYDPDSTDDLPADRAEVYAMFKHVEGPLWQSLSFDVPVSRQEKFCNTHTAVDSKLIDEGMVVIFSDLVTATSAALCDVIVDYDVELLDPQQALFSTMTISLAGISSTGGQVITPTRVNGPKLATFFTGTANVFYMVPSPGYYFVNVTASDTGAASPDFSVTNGTSAQMFGSRAGTATRIIINLYIRIQTNSVKPTLGTFTGDYIGFSKAGVADLSSYEHIHIDVTRITPTTYHNMLKTDYTTTAAGGAF